MPERRRHLASETVSGERKRERERASERERERKKEREREREREREGGRERLRHVAVLTHRDNVRIEERILLSTWS